ncbi:hydroxymyristoyl-ACP dehydratase [Lysinibacillus sp. KU-BSD001]|uniref:hydroxymyristoyl-ACP dehydratase n=1 Tax=Lysinibacillus sp. KU-BSD001 TaxID=3141328 RepID=UPI0036EDDEDE
MAQLNEKALTNKKELFSAENTLNSDFCDRLVTQIHKNILGENLSKEIYESYFLTFDRQYTQQEVEYVIEILEMQANGIIRSRAAYFTLCGAMLTILAMILTFINNTITTPVTNLQIFILAFLSFNIAIVCISYLIEREYKKINEVIRLLKYYLIFHR